MFYLLRIAYARLLWSIRDEDDPEHMPLKELYPDDSALIVHPPMSHALTGEHCNQSGWHHCPLVPRSSLGTVTADYGVMAPRSP